MKEGKEKEKKQFKELQLFLHLHYLTQLQGIVAVETT